MFAVDNVDTDKDTTLLVSPRTSALGMTGVALGESTDAIFYNPALLAEAHAVNGYVSSYTMFDDISNIHTAVTFPWRRLAFGIGYKGRQIPGVMVSSLDAVLNRRPVESEIEEANSNEDIFYIGIAANIVSNNYYLKSLNIGLNIKSINIGASGADGIDNYSATGSDMDLGLYSDINDFWSMGINFRNFISGSGGFGQLYWSNDYSEDLHQVTTIGNKFNYYEARMKLLLDVDFYSNRDYPYLLHAGLEIEPYKYLAFRTGINQVAYPISGEYKIFNDVTVGFAFKPFKDMSIDYSYYPGDDYARNALHYVGISFDSFDIFLPPKGDSHEDKLVETLQINEPNNYFVTEEDKASFELYVIGDDQVTINGISYKVNNRRKNILNTEIPLKEGINDFKIEFKDRVIERRVLKLNTFAYLEKYKKLKDIKQVLYTKNFNKAEFKKQITLSELADYIVSALNIKAPEKLPDIFNNVDVIYLKGFLGKQESVDTRGDQLVTKGEMALILARIEKYNYIFNGLSEDLWKDRAVDELIKTGYYQKSAFYPFSQNITEKEVLLLLAKSSAMSSVLTDYYQDFPLVYVDLASSDYVKLFFINAEKYGKVVVAVDGKTKVYPVNGYGNYIQKIIYENKNSASPQVRLDIFDEYGNSYSYQYHINNNGEKEVVVDAIRESDGSEELLLIKTTPKKFSLGVKAQVEVAVPSTTKFKSVDVLLPWSGDSLKLRRNRESIWAREISVPTDLKEGNYSLQFKLTRDDGKEFSKKYNVYVEGNKKKVEKVSDSSGLSVSDSEILVKTKSNVVNIGEYIEIYVGIMRNPKAVAEVKVILENGETIIAQKAEDMLWKARKLTFSTMKTGKLSYKVFIKDKSGKVLSRKRSLTIVKGKASVTKESAPVASKQLYPAQLFVKPLPPKPGDVITFKVKIIGANKDKVAKVSAVIFGKTVPFTKKPSGMWVTYKTMPKDFKGKTLNTKIYAKDSAGKFTMTKSSIKI